MKVCAITGSSGILGKKVLQNLPFKFLVFRGDVSNKKNVESWIFKNNFDLFIHFAAIVPTNIVSKNYKKAYQVNVVGTKNVIYSIISLNINITRIKKMLYYQENKYIIFSGLLTIMAFAFLYFLNFESLNAKSFYFVEM